MDHLTVLFGLLAAALFGLTVHLQHRGLDTTDHKTGTLVTVGTIAALFWVLSPIFVEMSWWKSRAALVFAGCGLIFPALSQQFQVMAVARLGASLGAALASMGPLFAAVPAVLLLGETLTAQLLAGISLMIAAAVVSSVRGRGIARNWPLWALVLPIGASFFRGIVQPVSKLGLQDVPSPFFSVLVMSTVSTFVVLALRLRASTAPLKTTEKAGVWWFVLNGFATGCGILAMMAAIQRGDVVVAAPLVSTTPLWTLLFGWLAFRREILGPRHLIVTTLVVAGVILVVTR